MIRKAAAIYACGIAALTGAEVPERWVHALAQVETGGVARRGDRGKAAGLYQFHRSAWADVSRIRRSAQLPVHPYADAWDSRVATEYAGNWLSWLRARLRKDTGRDPRPSEVFLAHNMGYEGFARIGFQVCRAPDARYDAALRFEAIALSKETK